MKSKNVIQQFIKMHFIQKIVDKTNNSYFTFYLKKKKKKLDQTQNSQYSSNPNFVLDKMDIDWIWPNVLTIWVKHLIKINFGWFFIPIFIWIKRTLVILRFIWKKKKLDQTQNSQYLFNPYFFLDETNIDCIWPNILTIWIRHLIKINFV